MTVYCLRAFRLESPNVSISIRIPFLAKHHSNKNIPYHCGDVPMYHRVSITLDIAYDEEQTQRVRKKVSGGSTHSKQFDFKETITKRYSDRRKADRKRRKILHILVFPFIGRDMTTIRDWRECYCVCTAWRNLLKDDNNSNPSTKTSLSDSFENNKHID